MLGLDRLELADQYAPVGRDRDVEWQEAVDIVDESLVHFEPRLAEIFRSCLERRHVDAEPRSGKAGGAYCNSVSKGVLPYVLMNFTDNLRDVVTLAHEFGHATHGTLALERQAYRSYRVGLAVAEVPSTFAQLLAVERLLDREEDPATRAMLLADRAENAMASIFRQTVLARFEQRAYGLRGEGKALTRERLSEIWLEENQRYYGDSLVLPDGYRLGWAYVPHFIHVRFYTYAYSFAHLVAFSLLARYREDPAVVHAGVSRVPRQRRLSLAAGAARAARGRPPRPAHVDRRVRRVRPLHRRGRGRGRGAPLAARRAARSVLVWLRCSGRGGAFGAAPKLPSARRRRSGSRRRRYDAANQRTGTAKRCTGATAVPLEPASARNGVRAKRAGDRALRRAEHLSIPRKERSSSRGAG